jgi:hypothetical protein
MLLPYDLQRMGLMIWVARTSCFLLLFVSATLNPVPDEVVGKWRIGKPYLDMTPQAIALTAAQEQHLVGQTVKITSTSVVACGGSIPVDSVEKTTYTASEFLQTYGITPAQIGLKPPVTKLSLNYSRSITFCGSTERLALLIDRDSAAIVTANDYFRLSKLK